MAAGAVKSSGVPATGTTAPSVLPSLSTGV